MTQRKIFSGADICTLSSFLAWGIGCDFAKTPKSHHQWNDADLQALYNLVIANWKLLLAGNDIVAARLKTTTIELNQSDILTLKSCIQTVLHECEGDPVELEVRVGNEAQVKSLLAVLFD